MNVYVLGVLCCIHVCMSMRVHDKQKLVPLKRNLNVPLDFSEFDLKGSLSEIRAKNQRKRENGDDLEGIAGMPRRASPEDMKAKREEFRKEFLKKQKKETKEAFKLANDEFVAKRKAAREAKIAERKLRDDLAGKEE